MEIKTNEKLRVRLESFNTDLLTIACKKIMEITMMMMTMTMMVVTKKGACSPIPAHLQQYILKVEVPEV